MTRQQLKNVMEQMEFSVAELKLALSKPEQAEEKELLPVAIAEMRNLLQQVEKKLPCQPEPEEKPQLYVVY